MSILTVKTEYVKIQKDTHRNKDRYVDCTTVENVMTAYVLRQPLIVTVGMFLKVFFKEIMIQFMK